LRTSRGTALAVYDLETQQERILLASETRIAEPSWSFEQKALVFSWEVEGNRDIWALDLERSDVPHRLTRQPGRDNDPVWDQAGRRIVFTSDRGRGLEFNTLFWIPVPEYLK
jgi:Tol biopolymer transport system component